MLADDWVVLRAAMRADSKRFCEHMTKQPRGRGWGSGCDSRKIINLPCGRRACAGWSGGSSALCRRSYAMSGRARQKKGDGGESNRCHVPGAKRGTPKRPSTHPVPAELSNFTTIDRPLAIASALASAWTCSPCGAVRVWRRLTELSQLDSEFLLVSTIMQVRKYVYVQV